MIKKYNRISFIRVLFFRFFYLLSIAFMIITLTFLQTTNIGFEEFCLKSSQCKEPYNCVLFKCICDNHSNKQVGRSICTNQSDLTIRRYQTLGTIALRSKANEKYVTVNTDGNLVASKTTIGNDEKFEYISVTSSQIALKSVGKQKYVSADNSGRSPLIADRDSVLAWEVFEIRNLTNGEIGIKAIINGKYVCAENNGNNPLIANKDEIFGAWEAFDLIKQ